MIENFSFKKINKAVAITLKLPEDNINEIKYSLSELKFLAKTLNISVVDTFMQTREKIDPGYYIGTGKLLEIKEFINTNQIDAVLFDVELTGVQARNLEKFFDKMIFGRTELILNIFHSHAKTREAKLQVQLASLEYMMPRIRNRWDHFSRVEGGIGARGGEGEKQIELDKRMIQRQIDNYKKKLAQVDIEMKNRRKRRSSEKIISLVGYTNAGKSTIFNKLTKSDVLSENKLFSTLDTTVRKLYLNDELTVLLTDTIGFINKLPHQLVASFKSTLEEIKNSALIIHVIDSSSPVLEKNIESVNQTLNEIGADKIKRINVYNKKDLLTDDNNIYVDEHDLLISALNNDGLNILKTKIIENL